MRALDNNKRESKRNIGVSRRNSGAAIISLIEKEARESKTVVCHGDGPSHNDSSGDVGHTKAVP